MASLQDILNNLARDYAIAWSTGDADAVAGFFTPDAEYSVNQDVVAQGRAAIAARVRAVCHQVPDLDLRCDMLRWTATRTLFVWTLEGRHSETGQPVLARGWDEWSLTPDHLIQSAISRFDAPEFQSNQ